VTQWTATVDSLSDEIDRQSQTLSRNFSGADAFTREMIWLNDLAWAVRADAGIDRRFLARAMIEQGGQKLEVAKLDQLTGRIYARWEIITSEARLPIVPVEMKRTIKVAEQAYFRQFRPARDIIAAKMAGGEAVSESRSDLLRISQPSFSKLSDISEVALSLTEAHAAAAKKSESRTFTIAIAAIVLSVALGFLIAAYIMRRVVRPLTQITQIMKRVADGDYRQKIPFKERKDEIGQFSQTLQLFRDNLAEKAAPGSRFGA
jgi:methyl-accepting chemotaxis protein